MRVSELEGALLDYWVTRAEGRRAEYFFQDDAWHATDCGVPVFHSRDWAQGGPILAHMIESGEFCAWEHKGVVTVSNWDAECLPCKEPAREDVPHVYGQASTLLVAAMRCYVASKFGEEVSDSADDVLLS